LYSPQRVLLGNGIFPAFMTDEHNEKTRRLSARLGFFVHN
jgi:hypothetical protein